MTKHRKRQQAIDAKPLPHAPNVFKAVAEAARNCKVAGLDSTNTFDKYDYRSIRGVMDSVHLALANAGVTVVLHEMLDVVRGEVKTSKGGSEILITYVGIFRVYGPAGDHFDVKHYCEGLDRRDKAANKASSAGYKEVLQKLLTLPFGHDEVEQDGDDLAGGQQRQQPGSGRQKSAINNRPKRIPPPWSGKTDYEVRYESEHHVHVKLVEGRVLQADARNMRSEDLTALEEGLPQRQAWFNQNGFKKLAEQAARDLRIVSNELLIRSGDLERPAENSETTEHTDTPEGSEPATPPAGDDGAGKQAAAPAADQDGPEQPGPETPANDSTEEAEALLRTPYAVHIDVPDDPENIPTSKGLTPDEVDALLWLHPAEIVAMAVSEHNAPLFDAASAEGVARMAGAVGVNGVFTPEWFTTAWLSYHEGQKASRQSARKLARLALATLPLADRRDGKVKEIATTELNDTERNRLLSYLAGGFPKDQLDALTDYLAVICAKAKP